MIIYGVKKFHKLEDLKYLASISVYYFKILNTAFMISSKKILTKHALIANYAGNFAFVQLNFKYNQEEGKKDLKLFKR